jgi:hypothetical protein
MSEVVYIADRFGKKPSPLPAAPHVPTEYPSDVRTRNLAERARAIVAAKNLELPELKHRYWGQNERGMLLRCILAMRTDLSESSAFTCARDIEEGRSTFEEVANGRPVDANRLLALQEAWKVAEMAYKTALEEECKRSGQRRMSVGHAVERARKRPAPSGPAPSVKRRMSNGAGSLTKRYRPGRALRRAPPNIIEGAGRPCCPVFTVTWITPA